MIEINLLPKEYQKKSFDFSLGKSGLYAMASAAAILVALVVITFYQRAQISDLEENIDRAKARAMMLKKDIQVVDALTDVKSKISNRMAAVERLDRNRSVWVRILGEIARDVPEYVWLSQFSELKEKKVRGTKKKSKNKTEEVEVTPKANSHGVMTKQIQLEGHAFTLNALAAFMINMMRSDYFDDVQLVSSSEVQFDQHRAFKFVLTSDLHFLSDEDLRTKVAQASNQTGKQIASTGHKSLN